VSDAVSAAYAALDARMKIVDVIANNLANARTNGFKRDFGQILETENGYDTASAVDLKPGDMMSTRNNLDAAIDGPGFFVIQTPEGARYSRAGAFAIDADGQLVNKDGFAVLATGGAPIRVGDGEVTIEDGGVVNVDRQEVGKLMVVDFRNTAGLEKEGFARFRWNGRPEDVVEVEEPHVSGGFLESSNVNAVDEMVHLMAAYRDFESVQRTLKTMTTDMNSRLIQELGSLT